MCYPTAEQRLIEAQGRLFLESKRFDRVDQCGRLSMFSLQMIDAEFCGCGGSWVEAAQALHQQKWLSQQHLVDIQKLSAFERLINNTDTHLGNLSLATHFLCSCKESKQRKHAPITRPSGYVALLAMLKQCSPVHLLELRYSPS